MVVIIRLLLAGIALVFLLRWLRHHLSRRKPSAPPPAKPVVLVRCHYCNMHLAIDEALSAQDHYYCCPEHIQKAQPPL